MSDPKLTCCLIGVGCNQGDCHGNIQVAIGKIDALPGTSIKATSPWITTSPVGHVQGIFLNGAVLIDTGLQPLVLMSHLLRIESEAGRDRQRDPGFRPIDLDILLFGHLTLQTDSLTIPHPRMTFRRFVLQPASEIAPSMVHPQVRQTIGGLLKRIQESRNVVAVVIPDDFDRHALDLKTCGDVYWIIADGRHNRFQPHPVPEIGDSDWLVVFCEPEDVSSYLANDIKLLVSVDIADDSTAEDTSPPGFDGPQWHLKRVPSSELRELILTAIQAMRPIG